MFTEKDPKDLRVLAPAKLNLILEVTGRRPDGYHDIDSLFVPIDLCDEVRVIRTGGPIGQLAISCDDPAIPLDSRNTVWRAVEELHPDPACRPALQIEIRKRIPTGAGLGGASSDAAAVLGALSRMEGVGDGGEKLLAVGARVGADVPFFLACLPARVRGIGDIVEPLQGLSRRWFAVAWPGFGISTRWAYEELDRTLTSRKTADRMRRFLSGERSPWSVYNVFEEVVAKSHPEILLWKQRLLLHGAEAAGLSGSGSAVFGVFDEASAAMRAAGAIRSEGCWAVAAQMMEGVPNA